MTALLSAANQRYQVGVESVAGTEVAATRRLKSVKIKAGPKLDAERFKASGSKLASMIIYGMETGALSFDGKATYEEVGYFIRSLAQAAADPYSMTVEAGQVSGVGKTYPGSVITGWVIKGNTKSVDISGSMISFSHNDNAITSLSDPGTPTPLENKHVSIMLDTTEIEDAKEWELNVSDLWGLEGFVGSNTPGGAVEGDIGAQFTVKVQATAANKAYIAEGNRDVIPVTLDITDGGSNSLPIQFNAQLEDVDQLEEMGKLYGFGLKFALMDTVVAGTTNLIDVGS